MMAKVGFWTAVSLSGLVMTLSLAGCGGSSSTANNTTATPSLSPGAGTYSSSQSVTISDTTQGAVLYCTTDGTTPTASSPQCSQPTTVYQTEFLQAVAIAPGKTASAVVSAGYVINLSPVPTPTFSPSGGTYTGTQQVTIADSLSGATLYYTLDGTTPTASSTLYTGSVAISKSETLNAIATSTGHVPSGVATAAYTIQAGPSGAHLPTITSLSPTSVLAGGATFTLTINGTNFDSGSTVSWASTALTTTYVSTTQLTASVPSNLISTAGAVVISVTTSAGATANAAFSVNPALPTITSLSPSSAVAGSSTFTLTVTGTNFDSSSKINWNGSALATTDASATSLTAPVSASLIATAGSATITVTTASGTSNNLTFNITGSANLPTVTALNPASGAAGTSVAITGTNLTSASGVNFGATPATSFTVNSATSITAVSPAGTGTVDVTVTTPSGTSATTTADQFTYPSATGSILSGFVVSGTGSSAIGLSASVQLYAAGTAAYGPVASPGATKIGSAVQTTPATGAFTVTYDCSTAQAPGDQLYLVATGSNNQVVLMTALGSCGSLQPGASYTINEATTVASVYALQQFMAADGSIGALITSATSLSYTGLSNAFNTVNNLVDRSSGTVRDHTPDYPTNFAGDANIVNNSTVPQARINTLANALNACVSSGNGCSSLFAAATVGSGSAPANTLQAILNIAQNPGNNVSNVYAVASGASAYTPSFADAPYTGAPNDWTIALTFTGGGLGVSASTVGTDSNNHTDVGPAITTSLAIDANGNIWVTGYGESGYQSGSLNPEIPILAEFNNQGKPQTSPSALSSDATPVITYGGYNLGQTIGSSGYSPGSIAIDTTGNIWAADLSSDGELWITSPTTVSQNQPPLVSETSGRNIYSLTIDNSNNAWTGTTGTLDEYTYTSGSTTLQNDALSGTNTAGYQALTDLVFDSASNLWGSDVNASTVYEINPNGSVLYNAFPSGGSFEVSLAADNSANVYGCGDPAGNILDIFTAGAIAASHTLGSRGCGEQLLLDGQGRLFAISNGFGFPTGQTLDEYTTSGAVLSPANGYTGTSSAEPATIMEDSKYSPIYFPTTGAIDGSGNLWLINSTTSNSGGVGATTGNVLVEFVGIAAPVVTPASVALANGQLGARP